MLRVLSLRPALSKRGTKMKDRVCEFECNIDDMTAEELAFAAERLMEEGAKDVTLTPVVMKKGRPATMLTVMIPDEEDEKERMAGLIFRYTTTIGIREIISERYILDREEKLVDTPYGKVRCKFVSGFGVKRHKFEYEDLARIAKERRTGISDIRSELEGLLGD